MGRRTRPQADQFGFASLRVKITQVPAALGAEPHAAVGCRGDVMDTRTPWRVDGPGLQLRQCQRLAGVLCQVLRQILRQAAGPRAQRQGAGGGGLQGLAAGKTAMLWHGGPLVEAFILRDAAAGKVAGVDDADAQGGQHAREAGAEGQQERQSQPEPSRRDRKTQHEYGVPARHHAAFETQDQKRPHARLAGRGRPISGVMVIVVVSVMVVMPATEMNMIGPAHQPRVEEPEAQA